MANIYNTDQTGIYYAIPVSHVINQKGAKDVIVKLDNIQEKKRFSFMPLVNMKGKIFTSLIIFCGKTGRIVDAEV